MYILEKSFIQFNFRQDLEKRKLEGRQWLGLERELEKLALYQKAFEEVIPLTGPYATPLAQIKVV